MPPARHATHSTTRRTAARAARPAARPRRVTSRVPAGRIRWDRLARVTLLVVLAIVAVVGVQNGLAWLHAKHEAARQAETVHRLEQANARLLAEERQLDSPAVIQRQARALGMVRPGERPYVVTGISGH